MPYDIDTRFDPPYAIRQVYLFPQINAREHRGTYIVDILWRGEFEGLVRKLVGSPEIPSAAAPNMTSSLVGFAY